MPIKHRNRKIRTRSTIPSAAKGSSTDPDEPTSPKVNCAGMIRTKDKSRSKNKTQEGTKNKISHFKNDVKQLLSSLKNFRFDLKCFQSDHHSFNLTEGNKKLDRLREKENKGDRSLHVLSLQRSKSENVIGLQERMRKGFEEEKSNATDKRVDPPMNALNLMRGRSTPISSFRMLKKYDEDNNEEADENAIESVKDHGEEDKSDGLNDNKKQLEQQNTTPEALIVMCQKSTTAMPRFKEEDNDNINEDGSVGQHFTKTNSDHEHDISGNDHVIPLNVLILMRQRSATTMDRFREKEDSEETEENWENNEDTGITDKEEKIEKIEKNNVKVASDEEMYKKDDKDLHNFLHWERGNTVIRDEAWIIKEDVCTETKLN